MYTGPLILLAAVFGHRLKTRSEATLTAAMGVAFPLFGTLLLTCIIGLATNATRYHVPSLTPSVAMALWSKAAGSAAAPRMMLAAITIFGAVRFGARVLAEAVRSRVLLAVFGAIVVRCSLSPLYPAPAMFEVSAKCLVVIAAVMTADFVSGARGDRARRVDWVGSGALAVGLVVGFGWRSPIDDSLTNDWWHPWLLPSYAAAFLTCLASRLYLRFSVAPESPSQSCRCHN